MKSEIYQILLTNKINEFKLKGQNNIKINITISITINMTNSYYLVESEP